MCIVLLWKETMAESDRIAAVLPVLESPSSDNFIGDFHFKLPREGLALRSVAIVDGVPELLFDASLKVPTIQEEDVATVFRLVSEDKRENKRPEFGYLDFPLMHPLSQSRKYMHYSPAWLRWTAVGKLLAESDWSMKCLHVGTRTNEEKSSFESWSKTSELEGLATRLDFRLDALAGSIRMSCDHAKVMVGENEIVFPEEPKMKIEDECCPLYSKYITDIYPSVAYYDEPKFLKMQELIKLILGVEWLYKEKGVRVSEEWMMMHTSREKEDIRHQRNMPPSDMIPRQTVVNSPPRDVTVKTREALVNEYLVERGVERRYGYLDFDGAEVNMFKEDGTCSLRQKCIKVSLLYTSLYRETKMWFFLPLPEQAAFEPSKMKDEILKHLSDNSPKQIALPFPMSTDVIINDSINESGVEVRVIKPFNADRLALPEVMTLTASMDKLSISENPRMPIRWPAIPGLCEAIIPDVNSWDELFNELSVPIPRVWNVPFVGMGEPMAPGGVTTKGFTTERVPLREEAPVRERIPVHKEVPVHERVSVHEEEVLTQEMVPVQEEVPMVERVEKAARKDSSRKGNYTRRKGYLAVRARSIRKQGELRLIGNDSEKFQDISQKFLEDWKKKERPSVISVFGITNPGLEKEWNCHKDEHPSCKIEKLYHGTTLTCEITSSQSICGDNNCGICGISCSGLDRQYMSDDYKRFGPGFYLAPDSSKSHDYTHSAHAYNAILYCDVCPGEMKVVQCGSTLNRIPAGFDSVFGELGSKYSYPELAIRDAHAVMPRYIIVYKVEECPSSSARK